MRKTFRMAAVLAALALQCPAPRVMAFGSATHVRITETVLAELPFDADSAALVVLGNRMVDRQDAKGEFSVPEAHFDNETFSKGSRRLREKIAAVMDALDRGDRELALESLGRGLHTAQDFFAHSNFIENNAVDAPVDLLDLKDPAADLVCEKEGFKGGLTSGYFPESPSAAKCTHSELAKDGPDAGRRYELAVEKAVMENRRYLRSLFAAMEANPSWDAARRLHMKELLMSRNAR